MGFGGWQRRSARGWWAFAARTLMLVLTLSFAGPGVGLAADLAFHGQGHPGEGAAVEAAVSDGVADPGLATHLHCGCHQAAPLETAAVVPPALPDRPIAARIVRAIPSVAPDRLPRPPRA